MRIGVDVDGLLRNLPKKVREISKREWNYDTPETKEWGDIENMVPAEISVWDLIYYSELAEEIMVGAEETPMAQSIGNFLRNLKEKIDIMVVITTMQKGLAVGATLQWLENHFGVPFWDRVEFLSGEERVLKRFDLAFEDNPLAVRDYLKRGTTVIMPIYSYNENEFMVSQPNLERYEPDDWTINLKYFIERWLKFSNV